MVLPAAVDKQCDGIENDAGETDAAQCCHRIAQGWEYVNGAKHVGQEAEEEQKQRAYYAHGEDHRKEMHELEALWIFLVEVDAGDATVVDLSPELAEVGATLMPHPRLGKQATLAVGLEYTDGEVDVLAEAHLRESAQLHVSVASHAHVERRAQGGQGNMRSLRFCYRSG